MKDHLKRCFGLFAGMFLLYSLQAQSIPSDKAAYTLEYLETISSYGDYDNEDAAGKALLANGIEICSEWLQKDLDSLTRSRFFYHRGRFYCKKKLNDSSRIDLEQALELDIRNTDALERLSFLAYYRLKGYTKRKGYINKCVGAWELYLTTDSTNALAWEMTAEAYELQRIYNFANNQPLARKCYRKCIELNPGNSSYYYELSLLLEGEEKEKMLRKALEVNELWLYRSHLIALYAYTYKRYPKALQLVDESIAMYEKLEPLNSTFLGTLYSFKAEIYKAQKKMDLYRSCKAKSQSYYDMD